MKALAREQKETVNQIRMTNRQKSFANQAAVDAFVDDALKGRGMLRSKTM